MGRLLRSVPNGCMQTSSNSYIMGLEDRVLCARVPHAHLGEAGADAHCPPSYRRSLDGSIRRIFVNFTLLSACSIRQSLSISWMQC